MSKSILVMMSNESYRRKIIGISLIILLISSGSTLSNYLIQIHDEDLILYSNGEENSEIDEYPPLPPEDEGGTGFVPIIGLDMISFVLMIIVISAFGWTGLVYYRFFKAKRVREKRKKKRY